MLADRQWMQVRLCPEHVMQLLYRKTRETLKRQQRLDKRKSSPGKDHHRAKRKRAGSDGDAERAASEGDAECAAGEAEAQQPVEAADTLLANIVAAWGAEAGRHEQQTQR